MTDHLDGPRVAAWIRAACDLPPNHRRSHGFDHGLERIHRALNRWEHGDMPSVYTVDEILTQLGHHICELPESFYVESKKRKHTTPKDRERALAAYAAGTPVQVVAKTFGVTASAVHKWRTNAGLRSQKAKAA